MKYRSSEEEVELPFVKPLKRLSIIVGCFAIVLIVDYLLPVNCYEQEVVDKVFFKENNRFGSHDYDLEIFTTEFSFKAKPGLFAAVDQSSIIKVCRTPLLRAVRNVSGIHVKDGSQFTFEALLPVYRGFAAFPLSLLIASAFSVFYKRDEVVAYCSGIISIVIFITILLIV